MDTQYLKNNTASRQPGAHDKFAGDSGTLAVQPGDMPSANKLAARPPS